MMMWMVGLGGLGLMQVRRQSKPRDELAGRGAGSAEGS
jgi:hypothetical protein